MADAFGTPAAADFPTPASADTPAAPPAEQPWYYQLPANSETTLGTAADPVDEQTVLEAEADATELAARADEAADLCSDRTHSLLWPRVAFAGALAAWEVAHG